MVINLASATLFGKNSLNDSWDTTNDKSFNFSDTDIKDTHKVNSLLHKFLSHENRYSVNDSFSTRRESLALPSSSRGTKVISRSDLGGHNARCEVVVDSKDMVLPTD